MLPAAQETRMITNHHSLLEFITILTLGIIISLLFSIVLPHVRMLTLNGFVLMELYCMYLVGGLASVNCVPYILGGVSHLSLDIMCMMFSPLNYSSFILKAITAFNIQLYHNVFIH